MEIKHRHNQESFRVLWWRAHPSTMFPELISCLATDRNATFSKSTDFSALFSYLYILKFRQLHWLSGVKVELSGHLVLSNFLMLSFLITTVPETRFCNSAWEWVTQAMSSGRVECRKLPPSARAQLLQVQDECPLLGDSSILALKWTKGKMGDSQCSEPMLIFSESCRYHSKLTSILLS